jgi:mRNA interferase RelE/StbE
VATLLYIVRYTETVIKTDIPLLPNKVKTQIKTAIDERLATDPISFGKPLRYDLKGYRRLRVHDYRIIYSIDPTLHQVLITAIKHRRDIYD